MGEYAYEPKRTKCEPIMADPTRRQWARLSRIEMERHRYMSHPAITADDVTNLTITLALSKDVRDVINA